MRSFALAVAVVAVLGTGVAQATEFQYVNVAWDVDWFVLDEVGERYPPLNNLWHHEDGVNVPVPLADGASDAGSLPSQQVDTSEVSSGSGGLAPSVKATAKPSHVESDPVPSTTRDPNDFPGGLVQDVVQGAPAPLDFQSDAAPVATDARPESPRASPPTAPKPDAVRSEQLSATTQSDGDAPTRAPPPAAATLPGLLPAAVAGSLVAALAAILLYHRLRGNETLTNATRKTIYDVVLASPGLCIQDIASQSRVSHSTAAYHLDRLLGARMVVAEDDGNRIRYYKNGGRFTPEERAAVPILQSGETVRVLEAILDKPWTYRSELAIRLGVTPTTINWHLKRLFEAGFVLESREGRNGYLYADASRLRTLLAPLREKLSAEGGHDLSGPVDRILAAASTPQAQLARTLAPAAAMPVTVPERTVA